MTRLERPGYAAVDSAPASGPRPDATDAVVAVEHEPDARADLRPLALRMLDMTSPCSADCSSMSSTILRMRRSKNHGSRPWPMPWVAQYAVTDERKMQVACGRRARVATSDASCD